MKDNEKSDFELVHSSKESEDPDKVQNGQKEQSNAHLENNEKPEVDPKQILKRKSKLLKKRQVLSVDSPVNPLPNMEQQKKKLRTVSLLVTGIIVPVILTILLAAFEDQTNEWVYKFFGLKDEEVALLEQLKKDIQSGKISLHSCTRLGATEEGVKQTCGKPIFSDAGFGLEEGTWRKMIYQKDQLETMLLFDNGILYKELLIGKSVSMIKEEEVKKVFGEPAQTQPLALDHLKKDESVTYYYFVDQYRVAFQMEKPYQTISSMSIEPQSMIEFIKNYHPTIKKDDNNQKEHLVGERALKGKGKDAVEEVKAMVEKGFLPYYDCLPLDSLKEQVNHNCKDDVSRAGYDQSDQLSWYSYNYKNRTLFLEFYKDQLSLITVDDRKPLPFQWSDVKTVFGTPKKEKKYPAGGLSSGYVTYQIGQNEVVFKFDKEQNCTLIQLQKPNLFQDHDSAMYLKQLIKN